MSAITLEQVHASLGDRPYMKLDRAKLAEQIIIPNKLGRILEIGHYMGASTCYFAAMAQALGGRVVSCDFPHAAGLSPNLEDGLKRCGLSEWVTIFRDQEGAEWRMMKLIDQGLEFDFVYIDAGHTVVNAALQFFLADRLMRRGGWIVFDDLPWTMARSSLKDAAWVKKKTQEEQTTAQVGWVWRTLVKTHPGFANFQETQQWGWCQKQ